MTTSPKTGHGASAYVIDVNEQNFETEVLARSRETPVVIDFWAPWCGPCRTLGPILERLAAEAKGAFVLAKVNVDENQRLSSAFRVQGIPAVKAVHDGRIVDEFTGALPESQVRAWLKQIVPAQNDQLVDAAAALESTNPQEAAARYRVALGEDPTNQAALFGLGRLLVLQGDPEGEALLREVQTGTPFFARAQGLLSLVDFFGSASSSDQSALEKQLANNPNDWETLFQLAALNTRNGNYAEAIERLLSIVQRNRSFRDDGARKALLGVFALLGDEDSLAAEGRRKLANALF